MIREKPYSLPESDPPLQPSRVRYRVLGMLFLLSILTFLDRVCIGSAAPLMRRDLDLTALQMGGIFSAFSLAYGIFEIPSGWLGDRFGPRRTLTRIVIWWSVFTALTGRVSSFQGLWITRFLFGAGEAGAYPNSSCAIARWFPFVERARAQAVVWMASGLGGAIAPLIVVPLQRQFGWRNVFAIFGAIGVFWAIGWYLWFRDRPEQKKGVNASEMQIIRGGACFPSSPTVIPWKGLVTSGNLWAVIAAYFASGYAVNFYFFWLPTYLVEVHGIQNFAPYAALPFLLGAFANAFGGWSSDALVRRMGLRWGRRTVGLLGLGGSVLFVLLSLASHSTSLAVIWLAMGFASANFALPNCWAVCLDIGRRYSGTVTGFMNTAAQIGGAIAATVVGYLAGHKQWSIAIITMALGFLMSALLYLVIDPSQPLAPERGEQD
jgi:ACS family glucarate transporter-like MFS transporter